MDHLTLQVHPESDGQFRAWFLEYPSFIIERPTAQDAVSELYQGLRRYIELQNLVRTSSTHSH